MIYVYIYARLGQARPGEEDIIGQFTFGREARHLVEVPNRELLIEFFIGAGLIIASSYIDRPSHENYVLRGRSTAE